MKRKRLSWNETTEYHTKIEIGNEHIDHDTETYWKFFIIEQCREKRHKKWQEKRKTIMYLLCTNLCTYLSLLLVIPFPLLPTYMHILKVSPHWGGHKWFWLGYTHCWRLNHWLIEFMAWWTHNLSTWNCFQTRQ